ncbi:hypothetical protein FRX31_018686, partial [Thalictrum thalictroides]
MSISVTSVVSLSNQSSFEFQTRNSENQKNWRIKASSAAQGVDLKPLEVAITQ